MLLEFAKEDSLILFGGTLNFYDDETSHINFSILKLNSVNPDAAWTKMNIELSYGRYNPFVTFISDEFVNCD